MYDKFDKLQVTLTNVFRTQLAMMGSLLEERLEARIDKRIAERLQLQIEQLREMVKASVEARADEREAGDLEFVDVDDEFLLDEDELSDCEYGDGASRRAGWSERAERYLPTRASSEATLKSDKRPRGHHWTLFERSEAARVVGGPGTADGRLTAEPRS